MTAPGELTFRPLTDDDLPLLHGWLNEPGVVRWWEGDDVSWEAVVREYGSSSEEPTEHWLALLDGEPVGWLQCYAWADYADEEETQAHFAAGVDGAAAGIDYLVADPEQRGRGLGAAIILQEHVENPLPPMRVVRGVARQAPRPTSTASSMRPTATPRAASGAAPHQ